MKKLHLSLATILVLSISAYFLSCKKDTSPPPQELPAVQKVKQTLADQDWEIASKTLLEISFSLPEKIKPEFQDFETDSNIVVTCRARFKDKKEEVLLPYSEVGIGFVKYYFYTLKGGKPKVFFYNSAVSDFNASGTSSAMAMEEISMNYTKIDFE